MGVQYPIGEGSVPSPLRPLPQSANRKRNIRWVLAVDGSSFQYAKIAEIIFLSGGLQ